MSKNAVIDVAILNELQSKGMSVQQMANRFGVTERTIYRKLKRHEPSPEVVSFAAKLLKMVDEAPDGLCRKELLRTIDLLRKRHNISRDGRKAQIVEAIRTGAQSLEDIAGDLGLSSEDFQVYKRDLIELLEELIAETVVIKQLPGGVRNRGRKQKYKYLMASCQ